MRSPATSQPTQVLDLGPRLVVTHPAQLAGPALALSRGAYIVGRDAANHLSIDDPYVSRQHARLQCTEHGISVEDLGSTAGVLVNGRPIAGPAALQDGDVLRLGRVELELHAPASAARRTRPPATSREVRAAEFHVPSQQGHIHNVAGDQHVRYALEVAPMRARARRRLRLGLLMLMAGAVVHAVVAVLFGRQVVDWLQAMFDAAQTNAQPELPDMDFAPLVLEPVAWACWLAAMFLIVSALLAKREARRAEDRLR